MGQFVASAAPVNTFDVVVIGGGPSGCASAITLAKSGFDVAMVERSQYEGIRVGETLPPKALTLLRLLGVLHQFESDSHIPSAGTLAAWGQWQPFENNFFFNPYGCGWHLDRRRFDKMLAASAIEAGVEVFHSDAMGISQDASGRWQVPITVGGNMQIVQARFLIEATGRTLLRFGDNARTYHDRLVGVIICARLPPEQDWCDSRTLIEATETGWWYSCLVPERRLIATFMTDPDQFDGFQSRLYDIVDRQLEEAPFTRERIARCRCDDGPVAVPSHTYCRSDIAHQCRIAVGDAASTYDPLSSLGIYKAIETGIASAIAVSTYINGDQSALINYAMWVRNCFRRYLNFRLSYYMKETRWPRSIFWSRRQKPRDLARDVV
jgi:flavin-dependent dehydrogenase